MFWGDSENKKKEKDYQELEEEIGDALESLKKDLEQAEDYFHTYETRFKGLIEDRVLPGCDFEPARQKKTEELATMIEDIKDQQKSLETAKIVAGEKRAAYKKLADAE